MYFNVDMIYDDSETLDYKASFQKRELCTGILSSTGHSATEQYLNFKTKCIIENQQIEFRKCSYHSTHK